jgi:hypothetical protein
MRLVWSLNFTMAQYCCKRSILREVVLKNPCRILMVIGAQCGLGDTHESCCARHAIEGGKILEILKFKVMVTILKGFL